ncbi:hypothetical protein PILCRDRAFT_84591 [Piloderma croceum F 1598]|uniref:Uncharacterized protein n=1 Tax=Piloderma croceum (strain F 1598) TaxID=765440 RepID=A0A0C3G0B9_PILCF|nr:hypothetical protein PILCRDRAFT_84591 [Piloderma croceum F 1598]
MSILGGAGHVWDAIGVCSAWAWDWKQVAWRIPGIWWKGQMYSSGIETIGGDHGGDVMEGVDGEVEGVDGEVEGVDGEVEGVQGGEDEIWRKRGFWPTNQIPKTDRVPWKGWCCWWDARSKRLHRGGVCPAKLKTECNMLGVGWGKLKLTEVVQESSGMELLLK